MHSPSLPPAEAAAGPSPVRGSRSGLQLRAASERKGSPVRRRRHGSRPCSPEASRRDRDKPSSPGAKSRSTDCAGKSDALSDRASRTPAPARSASPMCSGSPRSARATTAPSQVCSGLPVRRRPPGSPKQTAPTLTEALTSPVRTPTDRRPLRHVKFGSDINDLPTPSAGPLAGQEPSDGSPSKRYGDKCTQRRPSEPSTGELLPRHRSASLTPPTHCKPWRNEKLQWPIDDRDFDAPPGKQRTRAQTRLSESSTAAHGLVFDAEQCAVADDPLAAGTAHQYSVNVPVDINQSPPGSSSSRHQSRPDTHASAPDVDARARQERGRGARTKSEHTDLRGEPSDPPSSPSAVLLQNEAVRRLRKLYCQRTDGFEVLGARYKKVWGSTRHDL